MKRKIIVIIMVVAIVLSMCSVSYAATKLYIKWTQRQNVAHEIAELARSIDLPEDDAIIKRAQEIWWEDELNAAKSTIDFYSGVLPYDLTYSAETEDLAIVLAKTVWAEARGVYSVEEQAAIIQTIYNRAGSSQFDYATPYEVATAPNQFAYYPWAKTTDDYGRDLIALARDVIYRNTLLDEGYARDEIGIVLADGYCYFGGDGVHNYFRDAYTNGVYWNWSLPNPYES